MLPSSRFGTLNNNGIPRMSTLFLAELHVDPVCAVMDLCLLIQSENTSCQARKLSGEVHTCKYSLRIYSHIFLDASETFVNIYYDFYSMPAFTTITKYLNRDLFFSFLPLLKPSLLEQVLLVIPVSFQ